MDQQWLPEVPPAPRRRSSTTMKVALVGAGVIAGGVLAGTMSAGAAGTKATNTNTTSPSTVEGAQGYGFPGRMAHHDFGNEASGTVRSVGTATVTIKVGTATKTYQVNSSSHLFKASIKNGVAKLSDLKAGDAVHFSTTTANGSTIAFLMDGKPAFGGPGFGRHGFAMGLTGTVTSVGPSSVTIKVGTASKTYQVNSSSDIDKNGEAKLSDLKAGDAVRFNTTTANGNVIDKLHAGTESLDRPAGGFPGGPGLPDGDGPGHGFGPHPAAGYGFPRQTATA